MKKHNIAFNEKVLNNKMFDDYDKQIISKHLSNFYCVFQLGFEEGKRNHLSNSSSEKSESSIIRYAVRPDSPKSLRDFA